MTLRRVLLSFMPLLLVAPAAMAAITRRVQFERGRTSTVIKGKARRGVDYVYLLRAGGQQVMLINLVGVPDFRLSLTGSKGYTLVENTQSWTGELPESGDYAIVIRHDRNGVGTTPYTLEVTIR